MLQHVLAESRVLERADVHVGQPDDDRAVPAVGGRDGGGGHGVLAQVHVLQADGFQFVGQQLAQVPLALRARVGLAVLVGGGLDLGVAAKRFQKAFHGGSPE